MSKFYKATVDHYEAKRSEALAILDLYFNHSVGIGEHSDVMEAVQGELDKMATHADILVLVKSHF